MRVLIVGYGRMGKEIEKILIERNHSISARIDSMEGVGDSIKITSEILKNSDMVIEFSLPAAVVKNVKLYAEHKLPAVIGTTSWEKDLPAVKNIITKSGSCLLHGSNFSIGAHIFFKLTEKLASVINKAPQYDIMVHEVHHNKKKDSPSGTALSIAEKIINNNETKTKIASEVLHRQIEPEELHISSLRGGHFPGIHSVIVDSDADTIEITHNARTRGGFALGAVIASEWLIKKSGFFSVDDFIDDIL